MNHDELSKVAYELVDNIGAQVCDFYDKNPDVGADFYRVTTWALADVLLRTIRLADAHQPGDNYSELLALVNRYVSETYVPTACPEAKSNETRSYQ